MINVIIVPFVGSRVGAERISDGISTHQFFEYSLNELKQSATELEQKNQQLSAEIQGYAEKETLLEGKLNALQAEQKILPGPKAKEKDLVLIKAKEDLLVGKNVQRLRENLRRLNAQQIQLEVEYESRRKQEQNLSQQIQAIGHETKQLEEQVNAYQQKMSAATQQKEIDQLTRTKNQSEMDLAKAEQQLKQFKSKHGALFKQWNHLHLPKDTLIQQTAQLDADMKALLQEDRQLRLSLEDAPKIHQARLQQLTQEIDVLSRRKKELMNVLALADGKLNSKSPDDVNKQLNDEQLKDHLNILQNENLSLSEAMKMLEQKLDQLTRE